MKRIDLLPFLMDGFIFEFDDESIRIFHKEDVVQISFIECWDNIETTFKGVSIPEFLPKFLEELSREFMEGLCSEIIEIPDRQFSYFKVSNEEPEKIKFEFFLSDDKKSKEGFEKEKLKLKKIFFKYFKVGDLKV